MKYDIVLLDADGTLLDFHRSEREAVAEALRTMGLCPDGKMLDDYAEINDGLWKRLERGEIERSVLLYHRFELLFERYGVFADAKETAALYMTLLARKGYVLEGARELCESLFGQARLYIVTNGTESIQRGRFADSGLEPYFDRIFISQVVGYDKPDVRFFDHVAEQIPDFSKERALIVGDSISSDILGGIRFGIDTCWYNPSGKSTPEDMADSITYVARDFNEIFRCVTEGADV